ncbi:MAG: tRNA pseudouridine(38-40) synthase TruA [Gammaproteobacteria bacterium]|jgi:tRNA pseudouridine38-40 synthase
MSDHPPQQSQTNHYVFCVQYHGAAFSGWQRQHQQKTVQGELERALSTIANEPVTVRAAGRTDAGVHASGQIADFITAVDRPAEQWLRGVNGLTPDGIFVTWLRAINDDFHPRYDAVSRRYTYLYYDQGSSNPFLQSLAWCTGGLDDSAMHTQAQALLGEHDFSSFRGAGCQSLTAMRRVDRCEVRREGPVVIMNIEANAFLLHMVRNIASALHHVGTENPKGYISRLLQMRDRTQLGITAPAQGLYLAEVSYPSQAFPEVELPPLIRQR